MSSRQIDPAHQLRIETMELTAKKAIEGLLSGQHRSRLRGSSVEFLDRRPYAAGDPLSTIDWKLLARTDRHFVRIFESETNLNAQIVLDCSRSMHFRSGTTDKFTYCCQLALALTYLLLRQNDAVGLTLFDTRIVQSLPASTRRSQFHRITEALCAVVPGNDTCVGDVLHDLAAKLRRCRLMILISDLLDNPRDVVTGLQHLIHRGHDVIVLHILDHAERVLPYHGMIRFRDLEGTGTVVVNADNARESYRKRVHNFIEQIKRQCLSRHIDYYYVDTEIPFPEQMSLFLEQRRRAK